MKKNFALLILMILAVSLMLTACGSTASTDIRTRWEKDGEKHVFNITLADFKGTDNTFNVYNSDGEPDVYKGNYYKDIAFSNEFINWDEIRPVAVNGTYTFEIKPSTDRTSYCEVITTQEMYVQYNLKSGSVDGVDLEKYPELKQAEVSSEEAQLENVESTIILKSTTDTYVKFENDNKQKPLESSTTVNGFYVGKKAQALTNYTVKTEYNYDEKRPVAKITKDKSEPVEYKFGKNSAGTFIDSNQILTYLRSLDKSENSFQDSPSVSVFNPYEQTLKTASFGFSYAYNVILTGETNLATNLNVVSIMIGNNAFMMQENLPDTLKLNDKKLDVHEAVGGTESKFTTVRFRVGYFAYEIAYGNEENSVDWGEIWTALTPKAEEEDKQK